MTDIQSDYDLLMARVESGELAPGNLATMILNQREAYAAQRLETQHWQVLYNAALALITEHGEMHSTDATDLVELILWLAIPWGDNDPLFPESDGWTPLALVANRRMKSTWQRVVRNSSSGAVSPEKGVANGNESIS